MLLRLFSMYERFYLTVTSELREVTSRNTIDGIQLSLASNSSRKRKKLIFRSGFYYQYHYCAHLIDVYCGVYVSTVSRVDLEEMIVYCDVFLFIVAFCSMSITWKNLTKNSLEKVGVSYLFRNRNENPQSFCFERIKFSRCKLSSLYSSYEQKPMDRIGLRNLEVVSRPCKGHGRTPPSTTAQSREESTTQWVQYSTLSRSPDLRTEYREPSG